MTTAIQYIIKPANPQAHLFSLQLRIANPDSSGQILRMPAWIPGSYMIRDFAKNIVSISARRQSGERLALTKLDKDSWQLPAVNEPVIIDYEVYAWDQSVRSAHLDQTHAYFNGTSVFLEVVGQADQPCGVEICNADIAEAKNWRVATTLPEAGAERYGFGSYSAANYDELIDHPVEIADFTLARFSACGTPHELVLTGKHYADVERICQDLQKICEHHIQFFGDAAPMPRYLFLTWVVGDGYGGLEHRSSTSLICSRKDLPGKTASAGINEDYQNFLGLCSHEYFHSWNVKRIKPSAFIPYDLSRETHTSLLWAFEGITSYYDDLALVETGLISHERYLQTLAKTFTRVLRGPGRFQQSIAESSFDAWTKFYRQDENAVNAIVSYYTKGALAVLAIDLKLRLLSQGNFSFAAVMQQLWQQYQQQIRQGEMPSGVTEGQIEKQILDLLPADADRDLMSQLLNRALRGTADIDFNELLEPFGVRLQQRYRDHWQDQNTKPPSVEHLNKAENAKPWLGANFVSHPQGARLTSVILDQAASKAGLSAGDVIIAVDAVRADDKNLETLISQFALGDQVVVHAFRGDLLMQFELPVMSGEADCYYFTIEDAEQLKNWLGSPSEPQA